MMTDDPTQKTVSRLPYILSIEAEASLRKVCPSFLVPLIVGQLNMSGIPVVLEIDLKRNTYTPKKEKLNWYHFTILGRVMRAMGRMRAESPDLDEGLIWPHKSQFENIGDTFSRHYYLLAACGLMDRCPGELAPLFAEAGLDGPQGRYRVGSRGCAALIDSLRMYLEYVVFNGDIIGVAGPRRSITQVLYQCDQLDFVELDYDVDNRGCAICNRENRAHNPSYYECQEGIALCSRCRTKYIYDYAVGLDVFFVAKAQVVGRVHEQNLYNAEFDNKHVVNTRGVDTVVEIDPEFGSRGAIVIDNRTTALHLVRALLHNGEDLGDILEVLNRGNEDD